MTDPGAFAGLRVVVLGDAMLDRYARGEVHRLAAEAPAPVVSGVAWEDRAGGAANTAANAAALGARTTLVSLRGDDAAGDALARAVEASGVDPVDLVPARGRRTLTKTRLVAGDRLVARLDEGDAGPPGAEAEAALVERLDGLLAEADAVIVSDYAYGTVGRAAIDRLAAWRSRSAARLVADARDLARLARLRPCAVTPNHAEAAALLGVAPMRGDALARTAQLGELAEALLARAGAGAVVATLDRDGCAVLRPGWPLRHLPAVRSLDGPGVTGAGDSFTAALALALAAGDGMEDAARLAGLASGVAAAKPGTAVCTAAELRAAIDSTSAEGTDASNGGRPTPDIRARHGVGATPIARSSADGPAFGPSGIERTVPRHRAWMVCPDGPPAIPADGRPEASRAPGPFPGRVAGGDGAAAPVILPSVAALVALGERLRAEGRRIVLTSGCFDMLHDGHLSCLEEARRLGDALVVGVNSDASVRRLKGPERPVNPCGTRLRMLAALRFVDHVAAFEEDRPDAVIRALRPDLFAKGGDYARATLPEAALVEALGGAVHLLRFHAGRSSTALIARIRAPSGSGALAAAAPRSPEAADGAAGATRPARAIGLDGAGRTPSPRPWAAAPGARIPR